MRDKVKLQSTESSYFYTTNKNKRKSPEKLKMKKYDPIVRKHVLFEEDKLK
jgi:large subunit ribosomal protein L33